MIQIRNRRAKLLADQMQSGPEIEIDRERERGGGHRDRILFDCSIRDYTLSPFYFGLDALFMRLESTLRSNSIPLTRFWKKAKNCAIS